MAIAKLQMIRSTHSPFTALFPILLSMAFAGISAGQTDETRQLSGFGQEDIQSLIDKPKLENGDERVYRLFFRCLKLPPDEFSAAASRNNKVRLSELESGGSRFQFSIARLSATVERIVKVNSPPEMAPDISHYYRSLVTDADGRKAVILSLTAPSRWAKAEVLSEPIEFDGFYLGNVESPNLIGTFPHFVGRNFVWKPTKDNGLGLGSGLLELSQAGFDLGLLDQIINNDRLPLRASENAAFSAMLAATESISQMPGPESPPATSDLVDLVRKPQRRSGDRVALAGKVIKVSPVFPTVQAGFSSSLKPSHYQLEISVPLDGKTISIETDSKEKLVFRNRFPVTAIVPVNLKNVEELEKHSVTLDGFMYRFWNYQSEFAQKKNVTTGQYSPLIFVTNIRLDDSQLDLPDFVLPSILIGLLIGVAFFAWLFRNKPRGKTD